MVKKSFAVFGLGKFGISVAMELSRAGADVLAVDIDEEKVQSVAEEVRCAVQADVCDAVTMHSLGLEDMDAVIVAITGNLNASIMATIIAKEAGVPFVLAKGQDEIHTKILAKVGADKVMIAEREAGVRVARSMVSGKFLDFIELSDRIRLVEIPVKENWIGKTLKQLELRKKDKINVVAVRKNGELITNPDPDVIITGGLTFVITIDIKDIGRLVHN